MKQEWVLVRWADITGVEEPWMDKGEAEALEPTEMWSAGVIIKDNPKCLVIAGTVDCENESFGNINVIPKGVVLGIVRLQEGQVFHDEI